MKEKLRALSAGVLLVSLGLVPAGAGRAVAQGGLHPGAVIVLPDDGRRLYVDAIGAAKREIRIEICVLEDPQILQQLSTAIGRGVRVRVIVDRTKYADLAPERENLAQYVTDAGGELHLSNPVFPRSFPKIILVDDHLLVYGSACLDQTTFLQYRDFAQTSSNRAAIRALGKLFENDWSYSAAVGQVAPAFNPTPPITGSDLIISPVNSADRLVALYQQARRTLDVYTEIVGNPTLEGELVAAVKRGVTVRLVAPLLVNGATPEQDALQQNALRELASAGVDVHVSGPEESAAQPYMHARAAVVDGKVAYLGSISLSSDSVTLNREFGMIVRAGAAVRELGAQFESDFTMRTKTLSSVTNPAS